MIRLGHQSSRGDRKGEVDSQKGDRHRNLRFAKPSLRFAEPVPPFFEIQGSSPLRLGHRPSAIRHPSSPIWYSHVLRRILPSLPPMQSSDLARARSSRRLSVLLAGHRLAPDHHLFRPVPSVDLPGLPAERTIGTGRTAGLRPSLESGGSTPLYEASLRTSFRATQYHHPALNRAVSCHRTPKRRYQLSKAVT